MIRSEVVGEFAAGDYSLRSAGFLGGMHVLKAGELSLIGQADELSRDLPVTLIRQTQVVFGRRVGRVKYLAVQPGARVLSMVEGAENDIIEVIRIDRPLARHR